MTTGPPLAPESLSLSFEVLGARIGVRTDQVNVAERLATLWAPFLTTPLPDVDAELTIRRAGERYFLLADGQEHAKGDEPAIVVAATGLINRTAVGQCPDFSVHAGVVAFNGSAIAFPAQSGSGKSTIVAGSLRSGFDYVSDESLCMTQSGRVRPYPKPLALDKKSMSLVLPNQAPEADETLLIASSLGSTPVTEDQTLAHVVLLDRSSHVLGLEQLRPSSAVEVLLRLSFNHYRDPAASYRVAVSAARSAKIWRLSYQDPVAAGAFLLERLGS